MTEWGRAAHTGELPQMARPHQGKSAPDLHSFSGRRQHLSTAPSGNLEAAEIAAEQTYVTGLHQRLDEIRARTVGRLDEALATTPHNPQAIGEREAQVELHTLRIVALDAAESGLCFG